MLSADGDNSELEVLRIGTFSITQNGNFLQVSSGYSNYQWYDSNNNPISGANSNIFYPNINGIYFVD